MADSSFAEFDLLSGLNAGDYLVGYRNIRETRIEINNLINNTLAVSLSTMSDMAKSNSVYSSVNANSSNWNSTYANAPTWNSTTSLVNANSPLWNTTYTNVANTSTARDSVYTTVRTNSANYILDGGNTKGSNLLVGTNDAFSLALETNGLSRVTILSTGEVIMIDGLSALSMRTDDVSSRRITLLHTPENDGVNPNLFIGENSTSTGLSGFNIFYDEVQNLLTITSLFSTVSAPIFTVDRNGNANSPFLPYTATLTPYTTAAGSSGLDFYPASLSGVIPYREWSSRMRSGKGRIGGLLFFGLSATTNPVQQNKRVILQFSQNSNFTGATTTDILKHTLVPSITQYLRPIDGFMIDSSTIVFASFDNNNPYSAQTPNNPITTYSMGTNDLYYRIGFTSSSVGCGLSLSGGYISVVP